MDDGHPRPGPRPGLRGLAGAPPARLSPPVPKVRVYLLPCRVQQGWGDLQELSRAAWALHRAGFPLVYLEGRNGRAAPRKDPRIVPFDPEAAGPVVFPPVLRRPRPFPSGRAIVLTSWWGLSARREDSRGDPLPGGVEQAVSRVVRAHGERQVLHVSLEEFASDQTSREVFEEGLRQAGLGAEHRRRALHSEEGRRWVRRYHDAFVRARAGEREEVLHLTGSFAARRRSLTEFPFLLPVGPFGSGQPGRRVLVRPLPRPARPPPPAREASVIWYASPSSSLEFASRSLLPGLARLPRSVRLEVRAGSEAIERWKGLPVPPSIRPIWLPELSLRSWTRRWRAADLRIASGSQSLVDAVHEARPFLYFNGYVVGQDRRTWAFRREKLLSLLHALRERRGGSALARDLERFADGRDVAGVLRRALTSAAWRSSAGRLLADVSREISSSGRSGDALVVEAARRLSSTSLDVRSLVRTLRKAHARPPSP